MNTKLYLKQAWELLKQNRLFSTLYIVGTALAIAMTMMMAVIYYVRLAPVYPEERRATTLHMGDLKLSQTFDNGGWAWWTNGYSHRAVTEWFRPLEDAAVVSGYYNAWSGAAYVQRPDGREDEPVKVRLSDPEYFRLYTFRFKDGAAFTQDDFDGGMYRAVITDRLARLLFGADTGVTGRTFLMNYRTFTVCGVVEAPSKLMEHSYADMYAPYSIEKSLLDDNDEHAWEMGPLSITIAARDKEGIARIRQAIDEHIQRYNTSHQSENLTLEIQGGPRTHWQSVLEGTAGSDGSMAKAVRQLLLIVLVLLLVPALNLSGLIASRMESRLAEMGIRKTFGAWRNTLLNMVLWENLLLTFIGGLIGLVTAWICLFLSRGWVFTILDSYATRVQGDAAYVSGEMLFAPLVFVCALGLCLVLNLLSAFIPAWWSLRRPIVQSLYEKR